MWTDDRLAELLRLNSDGLSARQIADKMGGITRNAVIGKLRRMGVALKYATGPRDGHKTESIAKLTAKRPPSENWRWSGGGLVTSVRRAKARAKIVFCSTQSAAQFPPDMPRISLLDLKHNDCRFPLGDPGDPNFGFCGQPRTGVLPYCEHHAKVCYSEGQS